MYIFIEEMCCLHPSFSEAGEDLVVLYVFVLEDAAGVAEFYNLSCNGFGCSVAALPDEEIVVGVAQKLKI